VTTACVIHVATCYSEKTTLATENPNKARLTILIQNIVVFTKRGAHVDNDVPYDMERDKFSFFENTRWQLTCIS